MPLFTVICPTFNRSTAILPTVRSVLAQSMTEWELLVVSDGSDDDTDDVVMAQTTADRRVRLLRTPRFGFPSGPRNAALREARGGFVAYLDHDDRWAPQHLAVLAEAFADGADFVGTASRTVDATGRPVAATQPVQVCWHPELQLMAPLFPSSCVGHRAGLAESVGGWRESAAGLEDWDLWLRFADAGATGATSAALTVTSVLSPSSRRHALPEPHRHELARFPDARSARGALRRLTDERAAVGAASACRQDLTDWYTDLARRGELVCPRGWSPAAGRLAAALDAALHGAPQDGTTLPVGAGARVERRDGAWSLALDLPVMTAEHATRYADCFRSRMRRQRAFLTDLLPGACVLP